MGLCSICHQSGHNRRTCPKQGINSKSSPEKVGHGKSTFSTTASSTSRNPSNTTPPTPKKINPVPLKPPTITTKEENIVKPKNISETFYSPLLEKVIYPALLYPTFRKEKEDGINKEKKKQPQITNDTTKKINKEKLLIDKVTTLPKTPVIQTTSNFCNGCQNHQCNSHCLRNDRYDKKCSQCHRYGHNVKTCPDLEKQRKQEKTEKASEVASWLNFKAKERFKKGRCPNEGPGFIYMYTYDKPKSDEDTDLFKIGMSKEEHGKRRIEVQQAKNKEHYKTIYHEETPFRYLTENVIHLHLKDKRDPRKQGDGKTEWFRGKQEDLVRVIKDVIKEVRFAKDNGFFGISLVNEKIVQ